jgi:hypothetical protein
MVTAVLPFVDRRDMGQLLFKKSFWNAIRSGEKRTTIRRWTSPRLKAGKRAYSPGLGWLNIESVDEIDLRELDEADARADGFQTLSAMKKTLRELYPRQAGDGRQWFRIAFSRMPEKTQPT